MNNNQNPGNRSQEGRDSDQWNQDENERMAGNRDLNEGQGMGGTYSGSGGLESEEMQRDMGSQNQENESYEAQGNQGLRSDENWGGGPEEDTLQGRDMNLQNRENTDEYFEEEEE